MATESEKDWDEMNMGEKLSALQCETVEEAIELCAELLDLNQQMEDIVMADSVTVPDDKVRKLLKPFFKDE